MILNDVNQLVALVRLGKHIDLGIDTDGSKETLVEIMKHVKTKRVVLYTPINRKFEVVAYYLDEDARFVYNGFEYELNSLLNTVNEPTI